MVQQLWKIVFSFLKSPAYKLPYVPAFPLLGRCVPKRTEDINLHKNLCTVVHSSLMHDTKEMETTQMSVNE